MKIKIHRNHLVAKGACKEGIAWFDGFKEEMGVPRNRVLTIEWDQLSMVWSLSNPEYKDWTRWAIDNAILPMWSLQGANLRGANLSRADLQGADLRYANLQGADLIGSCLTGANINGANLSGANLYGADLSDANLRGAILRGADLEGADLEGANLGGANLGGANLEGAYYPTGPVPDGWRRTETGYLTKA